MNSATMKFRICRLRRCLMPPSPARVKHQNGPTVKHVAHHISVGIIMYHVYHNVKLFMYHITISHLLKMDEKGTLDRTGSTKFMKVGFKVLRSISLQHTYTYWDCDIVRLFPLRDHSSRSCCGHHRCFPHCRCCVSHCRRPGPDGTMLEPRGFLQCSFHVTSWQNTSSARPAWRKFRKNETAKRNQWPIAKFWRCRSNQLLHLWGASTNEHMVVEMRMKWYERIHAQLTEGTNAPMNRLNEWVNQWVNEPI